MLLGISLIPVLSLQLLPSSRSNDLSVSFSWDNAGPELLEMEVTTKLEGALARTRGLREIVSETGNGWGTIRLSIDKEENIDAIKLYLGSVVRSVKSGFPEGVQVSEVRGGEYSSGKEAKKERQLLFDLRYFRAWYYSGCLPFCGRQYLKHRLYHAGDRKCDGNRGCSHGMGTDLRSASA